MRARNSGSLGGRANLSTHQCVSCVLSVAQDETALALMAPGLAKRLEVGRGLLGQAVDDLGEG